MSQAFAQGFLQATPRRARANGEANKLDAVDRAAHAWYRFVLSFPPHLVRKYLTEFGMTGRHTVLDPFCGTGTTLVECRKRGIPSIGIEPNPMAFFASSVKVDWSPDPAGLVRHANTIANAVLEELSAAGIDDEEEFFRRQRGVSTTGLRGLPPESARLLLAKSISPLPLHKTLVLLDHIVRNAHPKYTGHERLALAKALVASISNLHFGPEVGVGPAKRDALVTPAWLVEVQRMATDLYELKALPSARSDLYCADARSVLTVLPRRAVDAVITSPPYPNEKDYTRTTRLESVLLGFLRNKADLRDMKNRLIRSNTRNVFKYDDDDTLVRGVERIQRIAREIERRRVAMRKTSGFERLYARVTRLYFGGMIRHLAELRAVLKPGARLAYVVGDQASYLRVMIRTGELLADLAQSLGYCVERIELFRTRLATATKEQLREEVVVLQWPGGTNARPCKTKS